MNSSSAQLLSLAKSFLDSTNVVYEECEKGIQRLDQIVVGVPSMLGDHARTALTPALYAYWERFFRTALGEYIRTVSAFNANLIELNKTLAKEWVRERCGQFYKTHKVKQLTEMPQRLGVETTVTELEQLAVELTKPINFNPNDWVDTESNVSFNVVERNFLKLGIDVQMFRAHFVTGTSAHALLKALVDARNGIAHGELLDPTSSDQWNTLKNTTLDVMNAFQLTLYEMIEQSKFLAP